MVHSRKHYVQKSLSTITGSAILDFGLATAVEQGSTTAVEHVVEGNSIKAIFIEMWTRAAGASPGSVLITLYKRGSGATSLTTAEAAALGDYDGKKNIIYHTQGLINDNDADAIPFVRQWFKIPKGKQRMGLGDKWSLSIFAQGAIDTIICGFATYKEYS